MAKRSFGTAVTITAAAVGGLTSLSISGTDVNYIDTTGWDTSGGYRTFIGGLKDGGTLELGGHYKGADAGQIKLRDNGGASETVVVTLADTGGVFTFPGIVGAFALSGDEDGTITFSSSIKIGGAIVVT